MSNKGKSILRFFGVALILVAMLDLIPVGIFSSVGAVYAEGEGDGEETPEIAAASSGGTGPTSDTPEQLGLPEDTGAGGYQDDCSKPGNTCEKEEDDGLGDVNEVGEGETFEHKANVVVIKAGKNQYFYKPTGPSCNSLSDPYCVFWGATSITVVRNLEGKDNKDISNIQFWSTDDDDDTGDDDDDDTGDDDDDDTGDDDDDDSGDDDDDDFGDDDDDDSGDDDDDDTGDDDDDDDSGDDDDDDDCQDTDLDGVCDDVDNCIDTANADQADVDNDGIGDVCDTCTDMDNNQICDDQESGDDDDDDEQERYNLILDPYCIEMNGDYFLVWEIHNPNNFSVNANWTLDGNPGGGSLAPGVTFVGYTEDGPATHTLNVSWEFGQGSSSSAAVCAPTRQSTPPATTITTANPPAEAEPIIPVTGVDFGAQSLFRRLLFSLGTLLFGLSMVVRGTTNKMRK